MAKPPIKIEPAGYQPKPKTIVTLRFIDGEREGAVVKCSLSAPMSLYLRLTGDAKGVDATADTFKVFGDTVLLEWNVLDKQGKSILATGQGMLEIDEDFATDIMRAWLDAKVAVPDPLVNESNSGSTSEAA